MDAGGKGADGEAANAKIIGIFEVDDGKTLTLENVILTKTEKYAVYVGHNSSLTMKNVTITNCKTQYNAAGIYFNKGKDLTLEHCIIEKCKGKGSQSSGGIDIQEPKGTVSIKDTTIKNCEAKANGGGVYTEQNTQLILEGTSSNPVVISQYMAEKAGGGMLIYTNKPATVKNARIEGNSANSGGGVYLEEGTFTIAGSTRVTPSTETTAGKNDVFLEEEKFITISGTLTAESPIARITPKKYENGVKVLQASPTECAKFTVTPKGTETWSIQSDGTLKK